MYFNNNGNNSQTSNIIISASELAGKTSYEGWVIDSSGEILKSAPNSWTTPGASDLSYVSPEVNGRKVTFRVPGSKFPGAEKVTVPGDMNNWKEKEADGSYVLTKMMQECGLEHLPWHQESMAINLLQMSHGIVA